MHKEPTKASTEQNNKRRTVQGLKNNNYCLSPPVARVGVQLTVIRRYEKRVDRKLRPAIVK
jgi:hypothetical protein